MDDDREHQELPGDKGATMSRTRSGSSAQVASPTDSSTRCTPGSPVVMASGQAQICLLGGQPPGGRSEAVLGRGQQQVHHRDLRRVGHDPDARDAAEARPRSRGRG